MPEQITLEEALELVTFKRNADGDWLVNHVKSSVYGNVEGTVFGDIKKSVCGNICGNLGGTINGRNWQFIETPKEKLQRLIEEGADKAELLEALDQLEDN